MQLDWFTVVAEIVNFLILIYLLKRFLYDRIIEVADEREQEIASRYAEADEKRERAERDARKYREKRADIEEKRDAMLAEAREKVEAQRSAWLEDAREQVAAQQGDWFEAIARERQTFLRALHEQAGAEVYAVARRVLGDLASVSLEAQVVDSFARRLEHLDEEDHAEIADVMAGTEPERARVRTGFGLNDSQREQLTAVIHCQLQNDIPIDFQRDDSLLCGVALQVNGHRVAWNIDSYLDDLEEQMRTALRKELRHRLTEDRLVDTEQIDLPQQTPEKEGAPA